MVQVTCPPISADELTRVLDEMAPKLLAARPQSRYYIGQQFDFELFSVKLESQRVLAGSITRQFDGKRTYTLGVGSAIDVNSEEGEHVISIAICNVAIGVANQMLMKEADEVAKRVRAYPVLGFESARGLKRLGCCHNRTRISLSYILVFLPKRLREYIVCHELAHLTHMDHSPEFHALVNRYTGGREAYLEAELRAFKFPIIR